MTAPRPDTWTRWQTAEPYDHGRLPDKPAVYVIKFGNEVVYIGQSNNLRVRFARHNFRYGYARNIKTPWGELPDDVEVTCKYRVSRRIGDWAMWEIRLIHRLQPKFNRTFSGVRWKGAA